MRNSTILIVVAAVGLFLLAGVGIAFLLVASWTLAGKPVPQTPQTPIDYSVVVSARDFAPDLVFPGRAALCESSRTSNYSDGEIRYRYEYDAKKDGQTSRIFSFVAITNICLVKQAAVKYFDTEIKDAHTLISLSESTTLRRRDGFLSLGDESFVAFFLNESGEPSGMAVAVREGKNVVRFRMLGRVIDDPAELEKIIAPKLASLSAR